MNILLTGGTSKVGKPLLSQLVNSPNIQQIICLTREPSKLSEWSTHPKVQIQCLDLNTSWAASDLPPSIDICLHLAGVTHSKNTEDYFLMNAETTLRLAQAVQSRGARRFCYFSSQVAGLGAGEYALSKFLAEKFLLNLNWEKLSILRPTEVISGSGSEGIDQLISLAKRFHFFPWIIDNPEVIYAPTTNEAIIDWTVNDLLDHSVSRSIKICVLSGPAISSSSLSRWIAKKYSAIPVPIWLGALNFFAKFFGIFGVHLISPDQVLRLRGKRFQVPRQGLEISRVTLPSPMDNLFLPDRKPTGV